jgi:hypothetical protein
MNVGQITWKISISAKTYYLDPRSIAIGTEEEKNEKAVSKI